MAKTAKGTGMAETKRKQKPGPVKRLAIEEAKAMLAVAVMVAIYLGFSCL